jgi:glycosyltransferase involved in cell wall biosynthesis
MLAGMSADSPPRIAFNAALLHEPYSGVEVTIHETACALAAHGTLPYTLYLPRAGSRPIPARPQVQVRPVVPDQTRLQRILWEQLALPALLRRQRAAVLHAPAYVAPLFAPCPVVLTVHDLHVFTHPRFCTASNRLHYRLLLPLALRRAAAIITYSDHVRQTLLTHFPATASRLHLIPPGLPARFQQPVPEAACAAVRARWQLPPRYLLFVGDLVPRKNLAGVRAAFAALRTRDRDLALVLAGAAPAQPHQPPTADTGEIALGYVPVEDLPALYSMAEALLFPSFDEGFGLPALEAMACGCPVIGSAGGTAELCGTAALLCDPTRPDTITAAAQALLRDPSLRRTLRAAGRQRAAAFTWTRAVTALETLYQHVAHRAVLAPPITPAQV